MIVWTLCSKLAMHGEAAPGVLYEFLVTTPYEKCGCTGENAGDSSDVAWIRGLYKGRLERLRLFFLEWRRLRSYPNRRTEDYEGPV